MLRSDVVKIVNTLSRDYSEQARTYTDKFYIIDSFDLIKCYSLIFDYCKNNHIRPAANNYKQVNGLLYINDAPAGRVALMYDTPNYKAYIDDNSIDYEALILARQEAIYD